MIAILGNSGSALSYSMHPISYSHPDHRSIAQPVPAHYANRAAAAAASLVRRGRGSGPPAEGGGRAAAAAAGGKAAGLPAEGYRIIEFGKTLAGSMWFI